jgi:hypothetical protein
MMLREGPVLAESGHWNGINITQECPVLIGLGSRLGLEISLNDGLYTRLQFITVRLPGGACASPSAFRRLGRAPYRRNPKGRRF